MNDQELENAVSKNKVILLDNPMGQEDLEKLNDKGWSLQQVVAEKFEVGRDHTEHLRIFYGYRYHHYFTNDKVFKVWKKQPDGTWRSQNKWGN